MPKLDVTLIRREQIASATWAFTLDPGGTEFPFRAGQTIDLTFPDPPYQDASGNRRTFSLAGAPGMDHLLVATRVRGSAFKRSLVEAPAGTALELEGPFGSLTLPRRATSVVMLAGGIGVTPFRAMVGCDDPQFGTPCCSSAAIRRRSAVSRRVPARATTTTLSTGPR
jgi:ferredoxin-NADP reductase